MATTSVSAHLESIRCIPRSLSEVQLRWSVTKQKGDVGGRLWVQISVIDHYGNGHRQWVCHRAARENVDDIFDVPSHLLQPGHTYEFNVKLMSPDQSSVDDDDDINNRLMQVISTKTLNFRSGIYATHGLATIYIII